MELENEITDIDLQLALKLKDKYPEHFHNLVRMHLSFALDLNIDENDEPADRIKANPNKWSFNKKTKNAKDVVDGDPLNETKIARMCKLISFLRREENIIQEGIFRKTGAVSRQLQLKTCLNEGMAVDFDDNNFSVHDCASVLKNFLAELPEPLVTDAYYPLYCQISEWCKCEEFEARLLRSLQLLMLLLPSPNALLLKYILNLLHTTFKHAEENKMTAENLATLFTPHVLCPRKFSGEVLHSNAQMLHQIVVFMIECGLELFKIPAGLAADIRLYWHEKEKKKLSPRNNLNESIADSCVVNTIFSFVDREKTAKENVTNPTETALAQLYAHIQSLPESSKKRKLVKQFNKENGYGTPKRVLLNNDKAHSLTKNISDSLKKHLFSKAASKSEKSSKSSVKNKSDGNIGTSDVRSKSRSIKLFDKRLDCVEYGCADASDDACVLKKMETREHFESKSTSTEKLVSSSYDSDEEMEQPYENELYVDTGLVGGDAEKSTEASLFVASDSFRDFQTPKIVRESLANRKDSVHCKLSTPVVSNFPATLTSTPAPVSLSADVRTPSPFCGSNEDVSPITMSAQKMPKSMQEVMMTPRSRQPVLAVSGSNNTNLSTKVKHEFLANSNNDADRSKSQLADHFQTCLGSSKEQTNLSSQSGESLTDTFREYLYSRSMLTTSIADDSFSSRTGDFDPSTVSEEKLSDSLLYCLDGGAPSQELNSDSTGDDHSHRPREHYDSDQNCPYHQRSGRVHETVL